MKFHAPRRLAEEHLDTDDPPAGKACRQAHHDRARDRATRGQCEGAGRPFTIARVISAERHPNADRLRVCMVDTGDGSAPVGWVVRRAARRSRLISVFLGPRHFHSVKNITLGVGNHPSGVESLGMLCSAAGCKSPRTTTAYGLSWAGAFAPSQGLRRVWPALGDPLPKST